VEGHDCGHGRVARHSSIEGPEVVTRGSKPPRWGQHFLVNEGVVEQVIAAAALGADDSALEIGPGKGVLTRRLLRVAGRVVAVEIDRTLADALEASCGPNERFVLVRGDVMEHSISELAAHCGDRPGNIRLVANLPYEVGTPVILRWLEASAARPRLDRAVVMVQAEVAARLGAPPRNSDYGSLSVITQATHDVRTVVHVAPGSFRPPPAVQSAVVELVRRERALFPAEDWDRHAHFIQRAFSQRRKQLAGVLSGLGWLDRERWRGHLESLGHPPTARAEELTPSEIIALSNATE
jgi:16S rRNA (adenine1518-N6/adenine1519-N6)-dimethyltransferase